MMRAVGSMFGECYTTTRALNLGAYSFNGELRWDKATKRAANFMALNLERYIRDTDDKIALKELCSTHESTGKVKTHYDTHEMTFLETALLGPIGEVETDGFLAYSFHVNAHGKVEASFFLTCSEERLDTVIDELPRGLYDRTLLAWRVINTHFFAKSTWMDLENKSKKTRRDVLQNDIEAVVSVVIRRLNLACVEFWHCSPTFKYFTEWQEYARPSRIWNRNLFYGKSFLQLETDWMKFEDRAECFNLLSSDVDRVEQEWELLLDAITPQGDRSKQLRTRLFETDVTNRSSLEYNKALGKVTAIRTNTYHYTRQMLYPMDNLMQFGRDGHNMTCSEIRLNRSWFPFFLFIEGERTKIKVVKPQGKQGFSGDNMMNNTNPMYHTDWWIGRDEKELSTTEYDLRMEALLRELKLTKQDVCVVPVCITMVEEWEGTEFEVSWSGVIEERVYKMEGFQASSSLFRGVVAQLNAIALKESIMYRIMAWEKWTNFGSYVKFALKWYEIAKEMEDRLATNEELMSDKMDKLPLEYYINHRKMFLEDVYNSDMKYNLRSRIQPISGQVEVDQLPGIMITEGVKGVRRSILKAGINYKKQIQVRVSKEVQELEGLEKWSEYVNSWNEHNELDEVD